MCWTTIGYMIVTMNTCLHNEHSTVYLKGQALPLHWAVILALWNGKVLATVKPNSKHSNVPLTVISANSTLLEEQYILKRKSDEIHNLCIVTDLTYLTLNKKLMPTRCGHMPKVMVIMKMARMK